MPVTPQITITGTLKDLFGALVNGGSLIVQLCNFGPIAPRVAGAAIIARSSPLAVACPAGTFNFQVWGNDVILPANTFYTIQFLDDQGNVAQVSAYQFAGASAIDLSTSTPYNSTAIPPPPTTPTIVGGVVQIPYSANPAMNTALIAGLVSFELTLTGNASPIVTNANPGQIVTFIFTQDATGARTVAWPANVQNATDVNPAPNSTTIQSFITRATGILFPIGPASYN